ncbi:hypothetical protein M408DRAFT_325575 [Serendipita vermifera MAFF 305830]|uniref:Uncharacterized protein n=1 Tax=Serendipita vermifera MAFF 305830 TaxID=933852 RepID=A0A0C2X7M7_SERVB|nr:hypothetical protein M408DRAFT_325575 [Serendipita vermifera MAFF 305830]
METFRVPGGTRERRTAPIFVSAAHQLLGHIKPNPNLRSVSGLISLVHGWDNLIQ